MGATKRIPILSASILALAAILALPTPGRTGEREVAGMITEIHLGEGRADVRSAETELWRPATPLLTLRAGDTVTTTQDAWVVIVLTGGRGSVRVDEANAPFSVTAPLVDRGPLNKGLKILEASFNFLSTTRDLSTGTLGTRSGMKPPAILTPRNGLVLPDSLVFEWRGSRSSLVTVRIVARWPVFERTNPAARFESQDRTAARLALPTSSCRPRSCRPRKYGSSWSTRSTPTPFTASYTTWTRLSPVHLRRRPLSRRSGPASWPATVYSTTPVSASRRRSSGTRTSPPSTSCSATSTGGRDCREEAAGRSRRHGRS